MGEQVTIYALCDPESAEVKYIGQTWVDPQQRLRGHVNGTQSIAGAHGEWLRSLAGRGLRPVLRVLEMVDASQADEAERRQILVHVARGCVLTNCIHNQDQNPPRRKERPRWSWHGTVALREEVGAEVERLARQNHLPVSMMLRTLVREALAARAAAQERAP